MTEAVLRLTACNTAVFPKVLEEMPYQLESATMFIRRLIQFRFSRLGKTKNLLADLGRIESKFILCSSHTC